MGLFYKISEKELLKIRNDIFLEKGIPFLEKQGFKQSPFSTAWFGKNNLGDITYELCRVSEDSLLETIVIHISKGDAWIKVILNISKLSPELKSLEQLQGVDGLQYHLPPNSLTQMRLRVDDFEGMPLFNFVEHKLKYYNSKRGLEKRVEELGALIEKDMTNIDSFVIRWHELYQPSEVDWEGNKHK